MTKHVHEWEITPQTGNFLEVAKCKICDGVLGVTFVEQALNEYETLKKATEALREYATHKPGCHENGNECICGLDDILEGKDETE